MSSRAKLLAELEEKSRKNKKPDAGVHDGRDSIAAFDDGYNPYDNPGTHKTMPDDPASPTRRRRHARRGDRR